MKPCELPDHMLKLMKASDRKTLHLQTSDEAMAKWVAKSEKDLQNAIGNLLRLRGIWFDQDSMAHRRKGTKSAPDFQFPYCGKFVGWEVKHDGGKLDAGQAKVRDKILSQGGEWRLITNLPAAMAHLDSLMQPEARALGEGGV